MGIPTYKQPDFGTATAVAYNVKQQTGFALNFGSSLTASTPALPSFLHAFVDGVEQVFATHREKFDALAQSWRDHNLGQSVIDYHDFAFEQLVGMGGVAVPFMLERIAEGESDWIYGLKCVTGEEEETEDMLGDEQRVMHAWLSWGKRNGIWPRQTL